LSTGIGKTALAEARVAMWNFGEADARARREDKKSQNEIVNTANPLM
jgi:hypothetical protein